MRKKNFRVPVCLSCLLYGIFFLALCTWLGASQASAAELAATATENIQLHAQLSMQLDTMAQNLNIVWVLICATLVFFMQAGFMCLECGLASAKNSINVAVKNLADFVIAALTFWVIGFALMFGLSQFGLWGAGDFFIGVEDTWRSVFFVFQAVFAGTAATIVSGAVSGRTRFVAYLLLSFFITAIIYPLFGHWAWGSLLHGPENQGWLERSFHFKDFAGSTVVHSVGAWVALVALVFLGPRIGKYNEDGSINAIPPHNMTLVYLGTFILFFGWFGFNCGSTLAADEAIGGIAINTLLSAACGCFSSSMLSWTRSKYKRPEGEMIVNGLLGGLVAITAGCAFVDTWAAALIGLIAGFVVYAGCSLIEKIWKLDDVVGAITVHGFCGAWGTLAVGIFIRAELLDGISRFDQILGQCVGIMACFFWTCASTFLFFKLLACFMNVRVSKEDEMMGLNVSEHGARSTLLDLATSMHTATENNDFSDARKVEVEAYTELGDLAKSFNTMLDVVQRSLLESRVQQASAEQHSRLSAEALTQAEQEKQRAEEVMEDAVINRQKLELALEEIESSQAKRESRQEYIHSTVQEAQGISKANEVKIDKIAEAATMLKATFVDLQNRSNDIDGIIDVIQRISDQTGLLALNAKIEAARAGVAGRGFSIIADEIGQLSRESKEASNEIRVTLEKIADELVSLMDKANLQHDMVLNGKESFQQLHATISRLAQEGLTSTE